MSVVVCGSIMGQFFAQNAPFNLDTYKQFLEENRDMNPVDLVEMYPAGYFRDSLNLSYDDDFWESSIYNLWLKMIRSLSPPDPASRETLPLFMQTSGWGLEKMNTQLSSWAELRHDNLLYAKQSYSGGGSCIYPCGYVEPIPEFYRILKRTAEVAKEKFSALNEISSDNDRIIAYFDHLDYVSNI